MHFDLDTTSETESYGRPERHAGFLAVRAHPPEFPSPIAKTHLCRGSGAGHASGLGFRSRPCAGPACSRTRDQVEFRLRRVVFLNFDFREDASANNVPFDRLRLILRDPTADHHA